MVERGLVAEHVARLQPYTPGKPAAELERELGISGVVKLASNENAFGPSPRVVEAIVAELPFLWLYPDGAAHDVVQAVAAHAGVSPAQVVLGNGSDELICLALQTFCVLGDTVATSEHGFLQYKVFSEARGMKVVEASVRDQYHYDLEALAGLVRRSAARIVFVANPANPTGTWVSHAELASFLEAIGPEPIAVVDEAYYEYVDDPAYPKSLELLARRPRTIVLRTFSKGWGLAGARVGYALTSPLLADYLNRLRTPFNVNRLAQVAACAALADPSHLDAVRKFNAESKAQLREGLDALGLRYVPSQTNFYLVDTQRSGAAVYDGLLQRGVIVRPMDRYGFPTCVRITAGLRHENSILFKELPGVLANVPLVC